MKLAKVIGRVWSTSKDPQLKGVMLSIIQPINEHKKPLGRALVAADTLQTRRGDLVYWVGGAEATMIRAERIPSDCTIVGLIDRLDL
jgi:microcompartment protein CcmK/EutM